MTLQVKQLHPVFVGEVSGVDLGQSIDPAALAEIQAALDRYAVIVFHDQKIDDEQQIAFARLFGPLESSALRVRKDRGQRLKHQELVDVSNLDEYDQIVADEKRRLQQLGNQVWHTDSSFKRVPGKYSMLHAKSIPPVGGETEFCDLRAAYDALPDDVKAKIESLVAEHSLFYSHGVLGVTDFTDEERAAFPPVPQVIVRVLPGSGRKTLYLASHASHIVDWPVPEGRLLLRDLTERATQREYVYRHAWAVGDLVMWDNRCTMHRLRPYDRQTYRRDLRRVTVADVAPTLEQVGRR